MRAPSQPAAGAGPQHGGAARLAMPRTQRLIKCATAPPTSAGAAPRSRPREPAAVLGEPGMRDRRRCCHHDGGRAWSLPRSWERRQGARSECACGDLRRVQRRRQQHLLRQLLLCRRALMAPHFARRGGGPSSGAARRQPPAALLAPGTAAQELSRECHWRLPGGWRMPKVDDSCHARRRWHCLHPGWRRRAWAAQHLCWMWAMPS
jgi:hypothetical protein